ncbi:MAG: hypothetical protein F4X02_13155 [Chloroflexi bacterium]|nr:hypothetical protein [Chloroflexota bacterium]
MTSDIKKNSDSPGAMQDFFMRLGVLGELLAFLWKRKLYWMLPMVITLIVFALLIVAGGATPLSPFIYTLF